MRYFSVKNFDEFQHYKDRSPPWIKLYNTLLDDYDFATLPDASKAHLLAIWLLASRSSNRLPYDSAWIGSKVNATEAVDLDTLAAAGFILLEQPLQSVEQDASAALAERLPREEESRGETEENIYRWSGRTIRLNDEDYERWKSRFSNIDDFDHALFVADERLTAENPKNWFSAACAMLNHQHQKADLTPPKFLQAQSALERSAKGLMDA